MSFYKMFNTASAGVTLHKDGCKIYSFKVQFPSNPFSIEQGWEVAVHEVYFVPRGGAKEFVGLYHSAARQLAVGDAPLTVEHAGNNYPASDYFKLGADGYIINHEKTYVPCYSGTLDAITFFFYQMILPEKMVGNQATGTKLTTDHQFISVVLHFREGPA